MTIPAKIRRVSSDERLLWIEPSGGFAGDMFLAALLELEQPEFTLDELTRLARSLVPEGVRLGSRHVQRGGFRARVLTIETVESAEPPERHLSELLELLARSSLSDAARARAGRVLTRLAAAEARVHGIELEEVHFTRSARWTR